MSLTFPKRLVHVYYWHRPRNYMHEQFIATILDSIHTDSAVLDLGSGDGRFARMFSERGAHVTAVDREPMPEMKGVSFVHGLIQDFIETNSDQYDMIFMRNCIQFMKSSWVFSTLLPFTLSHTKPNGIVAVKTFYQEPDPPFERPLASLYTLSKLKNAFNDWTTVLEFEGQLTLNDRKGTERLFSVVDLVVQRK